MLRRVFISRNRIQANRRMALCLQTVCSEA